jgi:hypothetical protein
VLLSTSQALIPPGKLDCGNILHFGMVARVELKPESTALIGDPVIL